MTSIATSFTAVGSGVKMTLRPKDLFTYTVTGTFVGTWQMCATDDNGLTTQVLASGTGEITAATTVEVPGVTGRLVQVFVKCLLYTSGTIVATVNSPVPTGVERYFTHATRGKAGATSGFVVAAADNLCLATCPASKTGSTLVIPVTNLQTGANILSFNLVGQIESAGGTVTIDAELRKHSAVAADVSDASVQAMTQVTATADKALTAANTTCNLTNDCIVGANESYYILVTVTTAGSTDVALQGIVVAHIETGSTG